MGKELLKKLFITFLILYCIYLVFHVSLHRENYQTDFRIYYYAASAYAAGQNPYDPHVLFQIARVPTHNKFVYPPVTLFFFRLFSLTKYDTAFYLFLSFKCALLTGLIYLWAKKFLQKDAGLSFYIFCLLAFNSTIYLDIIASNISILEQSLLWTAFYFFLNRKMLLFCLFILAAAVFKITPILFLILIWFSKPEKKEKFIYFFGTSTAFLAILVISYIINPPFLKDFIHNTADINERGIINPSTMALIKDAFELLAINTGIIIPQIAQTILFFVIITLILFATGRSYIILRTSDRENKEKFMIFLACLVYALILPRFKDYSYILLLVPTYFIIKRVAYIKVHILLVIFTVLSAAHITLPGFHIIFKFLWIYYPLTIAYLVWGLYLHYILRMKKSPLSETIEHI